MTSKKIDFQDVVDILWKLDIISKKDAFYLWVDLTYGKGAK